MGKCGSGVCFSSPGPLALLLCACFPLSHSTWTSPMLQEEGVESDCRWLHAHITPRATRLYLIATEDYLCLQVNPMEGL